MSYFQDASPESLGISSEGILRFLDRMFFALVVAGIAGVDYGGHISHLLLSIFRYNVGM